MGSREAPLSVRLCRQRVTSVSAPLGQFSTSRSSSGEFMPIPRIYRERDDRDAGRREGDGGPGGELGEAQAQLGEVSETRQLGGHWDSGGGTGKRERILNILIVRRKLIIL